MKRLRARLTTCHASTPFLLAALATVVIWPTAATAADQDAVRQYLDENTAASITLAREALIFARERTDLAVNARDYLSLTAIEVNQTGQRAYFWSGYVWSTIDRRDGTAVVGAKAELVLLADGRPMRLVNEQRNSRGLGMATPPTPVPVRSATLVLFRVDPEMLRFVAGATDLSVLIVTEGVSESLSLWRDARPALRSFVDHLELERH